MHLTDLTVRRSSRLSADRDYADDALPGFAVRVSQGVDQNLLPDLWSPRKRVTLGRFPIITLAQAREKARQLLAHRTLHGDQPSGAHVRRSADPLLRVHCAEHNRPATARWSGTAAQTAFPAHARQAHPARDHHRRHPADHGWDARDAE